MLFLLCLTLPLCAHSCWCAQLQSHLPLLRWGCSAGPVVTTTQTLRTPTLVPTFEHLPVVSVAAGSSHSLALLSWGAVYELAATAARHNRCAASSGSSGPLGWHCAAALRCLTAERYAWGNGAHGQLGVGALETLVVPTQISLLAGAPPHFFASGGAHPVKPDAPAHPRAPLLFARLPSIDCGRCSRSVSRAHRCGPPAFARIGVDWRGTLCHLLLSLVLFCARCTQ